MLDIHMKLIQLCSRKLSNSRSFLKLRNELFGQGESLPRKVFKYIIEDFLLKIEVHYNWNNFYKRTQLFIYSVDAHILERTAAFNAIKRKSVHMDDAVNKDKIVKIKY